jgi:hypothetical protein
MATSYRRRQALREARETLRQARKHVPAPAPQPASMVWHGAPIDQALAAECARVRRELLAAQARATGMMARMSAAADAHEAFRARVRELLTRHKIKREDPDGDILYAVESIAGAVHNQDRAQRLAAAEAMPGLSLAIRELVDELADE